MNSKITCPHCTNTDPSLQEKIYERDGVKVILCSICSKTFVVKKEDEK